MAEEMSPIEKFKKIQEFFKEYRCIPSELLKDLDALWENPEEKALEIVDNLPSDIRESIRASLALFFAEKIGDFERALETAKEVKDWFFRENTFVGIVGALAERGMFKKAREILNATDNPSRRDSMRYHIATGLVRQGKTA